MRHVLAATFVVVLAACGSSLPTSGTPSSTPASVAVMAGDGQQAPPGTAVAIDPAVIVKGASGAPVSGVTVTFAVDSGGGSITGATATTGSDGVAAVGGWTLGAVDGRNVLRATVGTLAPVRITAIATSAATVTYPTMSIGTGGGSINISQAGPLNGFNLTLPAAAFSAATQWTVSYSSNTAVPRTAGVNPITPLIDISSSVGSYASSFMTLTLPVTVPTGMVPLVVLRDPASGTMEALVTHQVNATTVTATTAHLNGAHLMDTSATASLRRASLRAGFDIQVFVTALTPAQLAASYDTHFRPGTDDWDFESVGTEQEPDGICAGISVTAIWYYFAHRKSRGPLFGSYDRARGVWGSAVTGIHWASLVQHRLEVGDFKALNDYINALAADGKRDVEMYNALKANMMITQQPQLIALWASTGGHIDATIAGHSAIAWKTVGSTIYIADASFPGNQTTNATFDGTHFSTFVAPTHLGDAPITYNEIATVGLSQSIPLDTLAADWASVSDSTINQDAFPTYSMRSKYGAFADTVWLADTLRIWSECPICTPVQTSPDVPEAQASLTAIKLHQYSHAAWTTAPDPTTYALGIRMDLQASPANTTGFWYAYGYEIDGTHGTVAETPGGPQTGINFVWLDWHIDLFIKLGVSILPVPPKPFVTTPYTFNASITTGTRPGHITYQWDFGDGTAQVTKTDDSTAVHTYATVGTYPVKVVLLDPNTKQPMVTATASAVVTDPDFAWQLTSVTLTSSSLPPGGIGPLPSDTAVKKLFDSWVPDLQGSPTSWLFYLANVTPGPCRSLFLEQFPAGQFAPVLDSTGDNLRGFFASNCDSAPYYVTTLTFGTPGNGVLTGTAAPGTPPENVTVLPGGSVNAAMNGTTLQGTFTWPAAYSNGNGIYSFSFTATRVLPPP